MRRLRSTFALIAVVVLMVGLVAVPAYADPNPLEDLPLLCAIVNCEDLFPGIDKCDVSAGASAWHVSGGLAGRGNGSTGCNAAYGPVEIRINAFSPTIEKEIHNQSGCCTSVSVESNVMYAPDTAVDDCYKTFAFGRFDPAPKGDSDQATACL